MATARPSSEVSASSVVALLPSRPPARLLWRSRLDSPYDPVFGRPGPMRWSADDEANEAACQGRGDGGSGAAAKSRPTLDLRARNPHSVGWGEEALVTEIVFLVECPASVGNGQPPSRRCDAPIMPTPPRRRRRPGRRSALVGHGTPGRSGSRVRAEPLAYSFEPGALTWRRPPDEKMRPRASPEGERGNAVRGLPQGRGGREPQRWEVAFILSIPVAAGGAAKASRVQDAGRQQDGAGSRHGNGDSHHGEH
jgi:hypothetical protein